jgi:hypothetical protein
MSEPFDVTRTPGLARDALVAAMAGDSEKATRAVVEVNGLGPEALEYAIRAWCDALIFRYRKISGTPDDEPVRPGWINGDTGDIATDADDVPPEARWAGRLVAARAALDLPAWDALLLALPEDGWQVGRHVSALLSTVAQTIRALPAGAR